MPAVTISELAREAIVANRDSPDVVTITARPLRPGRSNSNQYRTKRFLAIRLRAEEEMYLILGDQVEPSVALRTGFISRTLNERPLEWYIAHELSDPSVGATYAGGNAYMAYRAAVLHSVIGMLCELLPEGHPSK